MSGKDGKIVLKWILKKWGGKKRTGLIWHTIGVRVGLLWVREWTLGLHKMRHTFWLAEELLASQEGMCSMHIVTETGIWNCMFSLWIDIRKFVTSHHHFEGELLVLFSQYFYVGCSLYSILQEGVCLSTSGIADNPYVRFWQRLSTITCRLHLTCTKCTLFKRVHGAVRTPNWAQCTRTWPCGHCISTQVVWSTPCLHQYQHALSCTADRPVA